MVSRGCLHSGGRGPAWLVTCGLLLAFVTASALGADGTNSRASAREPSPARVGIPSFSHVIVIVLENREYGEVVGNSGAPTFAALARRYALLTDYHGIAHPSLPSYLALVSGSTHGINSDCTSCLVDARNLADTLEQAGKTWKTYAEGLPHAGFTGAFAGRYGKKHDPFLYFRDVIARPWRLRRVVPLTAFHTDLAAHKLPSFALVVPDLCHDMHDCSVSTGDAWLTSFLKPLLGSPTIGNGVIFVTFDEGTTSDGGGGHVPTLALGASVRPHSHVSTALDHYSLPRNRRIVAVAATRAHRSRTNHHRHLAQPALAPAPRSSHQTLPCVAILTRSTGQRSRRSGSAGRSDPAHDRAAPPFRRELTDSARESCAYLRVAHTRQLEDP